ncbi:homeobox-leucine zipper protein ANTHOCYANINLESS 2-like [Solanum stenotomum]|uniref:homeobox-leucine zipper protein ANTHOCYANINLESS 2-like n=1 Tax=Solanum stenotomum TaxID=172797 RepID=UPI0020D13424|nr:homeobox-leucine zipper protein ANTHOCYANINLESS 2-like [Solanum stenotomum]
MEYDKSVLMNHSLAAMNELLKLAMIDEPLWVRSLDGSVETLNVEEYARSFTQFNCMKSRDFRTDATRASRRMINNGLTLMEILMDKNLWMEMFPCIIGKTSTVDVISTSIGGSKSGILQLINTELQMISDLVSVREITFLRYCHQYAKDIWVIVDVSVDIINKGAQQCEIRNCLRLPSGCVVQDLLNGYSKVTWIEHMKYNENVVHHLYRPMVRSGLGFGAQRWMATLQRQSEFLGLMRSFNDPTVGLNGEKNVGMLAQRMTHNFCAGVCGTTHQWKIIQLSKGKDVKLMKRNNISDLGEPSGTVLSATKTIWLPVKHQRLFEFLINEQTRSQWDVLSNISDFMKLLVYIPKDHNIDNNISLFHVNGGDTSTNQNNMMILQDTCTDATGSLLVYATMDSLAMNVVKKKGDPSGVALFPCGIAIVPDSFQDYNTANNFNRILGENDNGFCGGSLVTIGFQMLVKTFHSKKHTIESAKKANGIISGIINGIKTSLKCK